MDSIRWRILVLGRWGFSAKAIQKTILKYDKQHFKTRKIYSICYANGIKLTDYRNADTREAQQLITRLVSPKYKAVDPISVKRGKVA